MTVLVTGGAGYIGSHVVRGLQSAGENVVVIDDLSTGYLNRIPEIKTFQFDISETSHISELAQIMSDEGVESVIHFAAKKRVDESVSRAAWYYSQNVGGLSNLLLAMERSKVDKLVFSSSAAVYGNAGTDFISEAHPTRPINPYGETKLVGEWLISSEAQSRFLAAASLRYFNVAGSSLPELGDRALLNLVPLVINKIVQGNAPIIFGNDYSTEDGTCVRDYIHVTDLADAHIAALNKVRATTKSGNSIFNIGTGVGSTVLQVVESLILKSHSHLAPEVLGRRAGDPSSVVADPAKANRELGWKSKLGLQEIVDSAWESAAYFQSQEF